NSDYMIGAFDGKKFTPETPKLKGHRGRGFYAAQTYSNDPKGRVVQIGWLQTETRGMPFNQAMSLPMELKLHQTPDGFRLGWHPIEELKLLRDGNNQADTIDKFRSELIELRSEFEGDATFTIRGAKIQYDSSKQEIDVNGHRAPAPLIDGKQQIIIYVDRTALEIFISDGLTYIPMPVIPKSDNQTVAVNGNIKSIELYRLKSIWR
ncbi:MAG: GH32 C-terminal domain-containing protein, partial [Limisphaerales bacterium]